MTDIRVLVADDHPIVREGLVALLGSLDGFTVVAEASDGEGAVREAVQNKPDVAVIDLQMPGSTASQRRASSLGSHRTSPYSC